LTISNNSLGIATNVVVEDYLPSSLKYLSSSINTGKINTEINGQAIRWTLSSLSPGETKVISLRVKAKSISDVKEIQVVNQATIRSQEIELSVNDNTSSVSIVVKAFFAPNVITPNGDGLNDTVVLNGLGKFVSNELIIFNRNGSNVFQTKNYQNDWSAKGLTNGTYLYKITSIDETGKVHTFTGWIQVIGK
jgi:gliding motility-associated-like protein